MVAEIKIAREKCLLWDGPVGSFDLCSDQEGTSDNPLRKMEVTTKVLSSAEDSSMYNTCTFPKSPQGLLDHCFEKYLGKHLHKYSRYNRMMANRSKSL